MLKVNVPRNVPNARAVEEGVDEVRREGLVRAVGGEAHGFAEQHGRVICATERGKSELCTYKLGVWGPAREHVCAPARMPLTISILFDDSHLGICEEGTRVGAGSARFSESFVVPHLGELVSALLWLIGLEARSCERERLLSVEKQKAQV